MSSVAPEPHWTASETWAWERMVAGQAANFNSYTPSPGAAPTDADRQLSVDFLRQILLDQRFSTSITHRGVMIGGARFVECFDLSYADVDCLLVFQECLFEKGIELLSFRTTKDLSLLRSRVNGALELEGAHIGGLLVLAGVEVENIVLRRAKIGGQADINGLPDSQSLLFEGVRVDGQLNLRGSRFRTLILHGAEVNRLDLTSAVCTETASLDNINVATQVCLGAESFTGIGKTSSPGEVSNMVPLEAAHARGLDIIPVLPACFQELSLSGARIGTHVDLSGARVTGRLTLDAAKIGGHLLLRHAELADVDCYSATTGTVDLRFAKVSGSLDLRRVQASLFLDQGFSWPRKIHLDGFQYHELPPDVAERPVSWFETWLAAQDTYARQPYQQLANVLQAGGYRDKADEVLYAGRNAEWGQVGWRKRLWLLLLWSTIGYGFKTYRALYWVLALTLVGVWLLSGVEVEGLGNRTFDRFMFTLDELLPVVTLDRAHDAVSIDGPVKIYFYGLRIMGWILGSFLVAGLSGLTKK